PFYVQSNIFRILAAENQTDVYINCNLVVTLDKGEYFDTLLGIPVHITSTRAIAVGQFERGSDCSFQIGDPNFLMYKPLPYMATKRTFNALVSTLPNNVFPYHFVTVFVRTVDVNLVLLDNVAVASSFAPVPANPSYSFGVIDLTGGTHTLECDSGFYAFVTGFRNYDAYSYFLGYDGVRTSDSLFLQITSDSLCMNKTIHFSGTSASGSASWIWDFGDGNSSSLQNPDHVYTSAGTYHVTLAAIDGSGCPYSTEQTIVIEDCTPPPAPEPECEIFVPNAFSPNGDGQNDVLCVRGWCIESMDFSIYDRWGTRVFTTTTLAECWNGTYQGIALEAAVFVYSLNVTLVSGEVIVKSGNISLIR
ncbi:MAG TPA: PKD domain-containing protein, partial [Bacteroidia bacterium]|nr:PKD domain-containing protein [Bacteroidia bacterium]